MKTKLWKMPLVFPDYAKTPAKVEKLMNNSTWMTVSGLVDVRVCTIHSIVEALRLLHENEVV